MNYTEIRVSDTGYGIKPEALPHIFDRYYQEGGKHQASGTGIGLSLVKNLVALHEGEIRVESAPNQGSTFYVSLLTDNSYPQALHADSQEKESNVQHIEEAQVNQVSSSDKPILLVVEDNPDICDYIAESFSDHFEVKTAANGKLGKESALKEIPDIIVSDIMMPVMDGNEMCRELKKDVRTSHIPIILLTAKDSLRDKEEGYQVGADSYLTKPFSASLLHSRIENLLQSRRNLANHFSANAAISNKAAVITESLNKLDNEFIHKINQLIEERLSSDKIDISYLSDKMCMSNSTLYRKMKALTGLSTNEDKDETRRAIPAGRQIQHFGNSIQGRYKQSVLLPAMLQGRIRLHTFGISEEIKRDRREIRDKQPLPISRNADSYFSSSSIFFIFSSVLPASMEGNT